MEKREKNKMQKQRFCKYCKEFFKTDEKHSKVCPSCKEKNHLAKIEKTLFGGDVLFLTIRE